MKKTGQHAKAFFSDAHHLQQVLRHLGAVTEHMDQAALITDVAGKVHFANTRWAQIHGYESSAALLDKHLREFYERDYMRDTVAGFMAQVRNTGLCTGHAEHVRQDGKKFTTKLKMSALKNGKGKTEGFLILADDLTLHYSLETELRRARKQVEVLQTEWQKAKKAVADQSVATEEKLNRTQKQVEMLQAELKKARQQAPATVAARPAVAVEKKPEGTLCTNELSELARMARRFRKPEALN